ncbi:GyrI-like domain-containing protein [Paraburkholderia sp. DHOC27]|uniref:AraC family transcriptional regulator n=1 Tax=Paraburkholderia sp. DHOC27 TaxID=2303330 RepID=UPI000E3E3834|nr:GyrI-like domain-containing protein [Paraburkholderia sp. DHOC27]RFU43849.1 AraC family transcriptional regulator [Paraburkholderia sp. DHOC27]
MKPSTERDYHKRIARVVEAILDDPGAPHTLDSLASLACLSPFHFHRIYRALTGERVVETVQRVRLARAAHRLTVADEPVGNVAADVGYGSPQAFSRAFRGFAGVSPSAFQLRQRRLTSPDADADADADANASSAARLASDAQSTPVVQIVELAPFDAVCLRHDGPTATISQTFRTLRMRWRQLVGDAVSENVDGHTVGICTGDPEEPGTFVYFAGIIPGTPVASIAPTELSGELETVRVAGGLYASHRLVGPYPLIASTFQALYGGWLPHSGYEPDDRPNLELYRSKPLPDQRCECVTDLMIPLRKE